MTYTWQISLVEIFYIAIITPFFSANILQSSLTLICTHTLVWMISTTPSVQNLQNKQFPSLATVSTDNSFTDPFLYINSQFYWTLNNDFLFGVNTKITISTEEQVYPNGSWLSYQYLISNDPYVLTEQQASQTCICRYTHKLIKAYKYTPKHTSTQSVKISMGNC
jgi:hypothetical protein